MADHIARMERERMRIEFWWRSLVRVPRRWDDVIKIWSVGN